MKNTKEMSSKEYPTCPFCRPDNTCLRHKQKNVPKVKTMKPIKKVSDKKKLLEPIEKADKKRLTVFYNEMLNVMPFTCQECDDPLFKSQVLNPRTPIAHILDKAHFKSVDTNPDNIVFLCQLHHGRLDNQREKYLSTSKLTTIIKQRVQVLIPLLTEDELKRVPDYLLTNSLQ